MLRPALLLPARSFRHVGLLTPGFTSRHLCLKCWSASGLSGDYPRGTFTRWRGAARLGFGGRFRDLQLRAFTTHHGREFNAVLLASLQRRLEGV
jgi:hypothetical protein